MDQENLEYGQEVHVVFFDDHGGRNIDEIFINRDDAVEYLENLGDHSVKKRRNEWEVTFDGKGKFKHVLTKMNLVNNYSKY